MTLLVLSQSVTAQNNSTEALTLSYHGFITHLDQTVVNGERGITFRIYDALVDGHLLWEEQQQAIPIIEGKFQANLGIITPLPISISPDTPLFLSIQVEGDRELTPRLRIGTAIRSLWADRAEQASLADHATDVSGEHIHPATISIGEREVINAQGECVGAPIEGVTSDAVDYADLANRLVNDSIFHSEVANTLVIEQVDALRVVDRPPDQLERPRVQVPAQVIQRASLERRCRRAVRAQRR